MKYLIVGLGNPGYEYAQNRHNIGFKILETLALKEGLHFENKRLAAVAQFKYKARILVCIKPSTYMNLSGKAVNYWLNAENIPIENMLVLTDDLAIPFGSIRIKQKGGAGGHNGLTDIILQTQTEQFARLRFGIGSEFSKGQQVDYVLGNWSDKENTVLPERLDKCIEAVKSFATIGIERTMNFFNDKYKFPTPEAEKTE